MTTTTATNGAGAMHKLLNIFAAPSEAFRALRQKPTFLLPMAVLLLGSVAVILWYYSAVDVVWMIETSLERAGTEMPADQREQLLRSMGSVPPMAMGASAAVASALFVAVLLLLAGGYLTLVSMFTNDGLKFRNWFSLVSWSSFPVALSQLATLVNLAVSDVTFLPAEELNPLSFAGLLALDVEGVSFLARVLQTIDPTSIWALALMVYGYHSWTRKPLGVAVLIVAGPLLVLFLVGALVV